jgi:hypothetical protein
VPVVCFIGPETVLAVYSYDERPYKTVGTRYDLEKSVQLLGLGIFSYGMKDFKYEKNI